MATIYSSSSAMMEPPFFGHNDPLFSSTAPIHMMTSNDIWLPECTFDMPTPPVSPSHNDPTNNNNNNNDHHHHHPCIKTEQQQQHQQQQPSIEDDLDLGIGELINTMDLPSPLFFDDLVTDSWMNDVLDPLTPDVLETNKCEGGNDQVSELRHDCMWAGHCPAEEHRSKKDLVQLPCLLSSSPPESTVLASMPLSSCLVLPPVATRTRLDTLGSIRPETPLSLSDSELDADQLTSDEGHNVKDNQSSSSSGDESDEDEDQPMVYQPTLPPNIHPVRSHQIRKLANSSGNSKSLVKMMVSSSLIGDHSYSHSDHSYHTQRRPNDLPAIPFDLGAPTPSDSEEEIDVVSLGEVLRMNPSGMMTVHKSSISATTAATSSSITNGSSNHGPIRLKLKVAPAATIDSADSASSGQQVLMRKALPSHPSALVRQQLQLAVATAAQQRKQSETKKSSKSNGDRSGSTSSSSSSGGGVSKRARSSGAENSGSSSPRKRSSRAASDSEDSCEKRSQHNSMERQRRVDLRNAFEFLRSLIPDLETTDRAAKVVILKKAAHFCQGLTQREKQFVADKDALQKRQEMLRKRLALLQRRR